MDMGGMDGGEDMMSAMVSAKKAPSSKPKDDEVGYAIPVRLVYRANNRQTWEYIYEAMRRQPTTELHRMAFVSLSQYPQYQTNTQIETTVTFITVPKMFEQFGAIQGKLKDIAPGQGPAAGEEASQ